MIWRVLYQKNDEGGFDLQIETAEAYGEDYYKVSVAMNLSPEEYNSFRAGMAKAEYVQVDPGTITKEEELTRDRAATFLRELDYLVVSKRGISPKGDQQSDEDASNYTAHCELGLATDTGEGVDKVCTLWDTLNDGCDRCPFNTGDE